MKGLAGPTPDPWPVGAASSGERSLEGRHVVVTGAAGFIGAFVAAELAARGAAVLAIDREPGRRRPVVGPIAKGRITFLAAPTRWPYPPSWWDFVENEGLLATVDSLVHLGYREPTASHPIGAYRQEVEANVLPSVAMLERLDPRITTVVVASSSMVYGPAHRTAIPETAELRPDSSYGLAKFDLERALAWWAGDGRRVIAARIATVYGPTETVPRAVPNFIRAALAGRRPEVVVGDDRRDYINVIDVARGLATMVGQAPGIVGPAGGSVAVNLGTGTATTTLELATTILAVSGLGGEPTVAPQPRRPVSVVVDPSFLADRTGFRPTVPLRAGLVEEMDWFRHHPELWCPSAGAAEPERPRP